MQLRATQKSIACPTHNQCEIQEVFVSRIQDNKCVVLKIQSMDIKTKVLNIN